MRTLQKAYNYRLRPTPNQEALFRQFAGARRWVWNWALRRRSEHYKASGKGLSVTALCAELTVLKRVPETSWLNEMDSQALQQAIRDLDKAFVAFFQKRSRFPRFKSKKRSTLSFRIPQRVVLRGEQLLVPKVGAVSVVLHRPLEGVPKSATFKQDRTGAWTVSLVVHFDLPDMLLSPPDAERTIGVDLGLKDLAVTSLGERVAAPKHYRRAERKLRRLQRHLSRCKRGSKKREKARVALAKLHLRVANQRRDHLHKLTTNLVRSADAICIEDLHVKGVAKTKLAKSVHDAGWGVLRFQLSYKCLWQRKHLVMIDRFYPSSRLCRACGCINEALTLAERVWTCACGATHECRETVKLARWMC
jgi:putative transposase